MPARSTVPRALPGSSESCAGSVAGSSPMRIGGKALKALGYLKALMSAPRSRPEAGWGWCSPAAGAKNAPRRTISPRYRIWKNRLACPSQMWRNHPRGMWPLRIGGSSPLPPSSLNALNCSVLCPCDSALHQCLLQVAECVQFAKGGFVCDGVRLASLTCIVEERLKTVFHAFEQGCSDEE